MEGFVDPQFASEFETHPNTQTSSSTPQHTSNAPQQGFQSTKSTDPFGGGFDAAWTNSTSFSAFDSSASTGSLDRPLSNGNQFNVAPSSGKTPLFTSTKNAADTLPSQQSFASTFNSQSGGRDGGGTALPMRGGASYRADPNSFVKSGKCPHGQLGSSKEERGNDK
jgi:hypothetical protein